VPGICAVDGDVVDQHAVVERHVRGHRRGGDAGQLLGALEDGLDELAAPLGRVLLQAEIDRGEQQAVGADAERDVLHLPQAVQEQARAREHHEREADLADDEQRCAGDDGVRPASRAPSFSDSTRLNREAWRAGHSAVAMPAIADTSTVKG
jgi:hypothetical protein